jgi:outer membrane protein assembly factor BamB
MGQRHKSATISLLAVLALAVLLVSGCAPPWDRPTLPAHVTLYMASDARDGIFASAVDGTTGKQVWRTPLASRAVGPILAGGTLYVTATSGYVFALNARDGSLRWRAAVSPDVFPTDFVLDGSTLYVSTIDYTEHTSALRALDAATGQLRWRAAFPGYFSPGLTPTGDRIYLGWSTCGGPCPTGALLALNARTGAIVWRHELPGDPYSRPVVAGNRVYMSVDGGWVEAFDAATGAQLWRTQPPGYEVGLSHVDVAGGLVYVAASRAFFALDGNDGHVRWRAQVPGSPDRTHQQYGPAVVHDTLYALANNDETAYALDPKTGSIRWQYNGLGYSPALAPAVDRGVTYLLTADGAIVALRESDGAFIKRFELGLIDTYAAPVVGQ